MKLSKLSFAFSYVLIPLIIIICLIVLNHGCEDTQNITKEVTEPAAAPTLSAKEISEATDLMKEFRPTVKINGGEEKEVEVELYLGGEMEPNKMYFIFPKMRKTAVEENPEWAEIDSMGGLNMKQ